MTSVLSTDARKNWLLSKACKGLDVSQDLCEALLSEDKAQIDLSTFLDGGDCGLVPVEARVPSTKPVLTLPVMSRHFICSSDLCGRDRAVCQGCSDCCAATKASSSRVTLLPVLPVILVDTHI